jgi:hypothetical protein
MPRSTERSRSSLQSLAIFLIVIDIPTHSLSYYATRFLWPISEFRIDGIAWWTRWFWAATYAALAVVYVLLWRKGWLSRTRLSPEMVANQGGQEAARR